MKGSLTDRGPHSQLAHPEDVSMQNSQGGTVFLISSRMLRSSRPATAEDSACDSCCVSCSCSCPPRCCPSASARSSRRSAI